MQTLILIVSKRRKRAVKSQKVIIFKNHKNWTVATVYATNKRQ